MIKFSLNGETVEVDAPPTTTLLDWLREERRLTGTAQAQYEGWRRLLKQIYQAETGFAETVDVGAPARMNSAE